jgi:arsenate reductase
MSDVTLFHNPNCGTSRKVLAALRDAGVQPAVVDYMKTGWTRPQLQALVAALGPGARPRDLLRAKEPLATELGLKDPRASDDALLDAMAAHPVLVDRPIVQTAAGARLCRPAERVAELVPTASVAAAR